jgi:hypothetical protein
MTGGDIYGAIQGTVWMNHQWFRTLYFEGLHPLDAPTGSFPHLNLDYREDPVDSRSEASSSDVDAPMTLEAATGEPSPTGPRGGPVALAEFQRLRAVSTQTIWILSLLVACGSLLTEILLVVPGRRCDQRGKNEGKVRAA